MSGPLEQLQFTEEEIDHGVAELLRQTHGEWPYAAEAVRAVLRAVRAVPARCLNGHIAGEPAAVGAKVRGTGLVGAWVQGTVMESYPVTTTVRAPDGRTDYLWTNTIRSWDPSTEKAPSTPATLQGSPLGLMSGKIVLNGDASDLLRADDDGMVVEEGR